ncbi:hypothetical protein BT93_C0652 [Corymbia citriodora subsp. variegata]|nr:hypothetical protein BT93_C0652 [Corymbia citriodora subsp. variegata]
MSSISTVKLPPIDLSELDGSKPRTGRWDSSQSRVRRALEEFGCFEALYDKMTLELHNDAFQESEELLELPTDVRHRFHFPAKPSVGYFANWSAQGSIEGLADLMWPEGNTRFCETMNAYVTRVLELDSLVKKLTLGSLGFDEYMESLAKLVEYNFPLMRYAASETEESKKPEAACHRDANFMTILHQNHANGLEGWSNGRLHGPCHRVMMSGHEARYCIGLFSSIQGTVQCPDELVDNHHPLLFKPFDVLCLSRIYKTKENQNGASAMDTYYRI